MSPPRRPLVLITSRYPEALVASLAERATVRQGTEAERGMPREQALELLQDAVALITNNELKIDSELLARSPRLRLVANATAGFDNMDIAAMRRRGVWGANSPDSFSADTANHTIGLLLALARRLPEADRYVRSGQWARDGWMPGGRWDGVALEGKRFGIIGYGHIGRQVGRRAKAFGMTVRHHARSEHDDPEWMRLEALLGWADIVSLHCPLTPETHHLINAGTLGLMKPGAFLLNVARGGVVQTDDLIAALESGRLAGAGLDVVENEPSLPAALLRLSNVVLSPHMGGCTQEARQSAWCTCIDNVIRVLDGNPPNTPVFDLEDRA
jgi:glyoxylate reductase